MANPQQILADPNFHALPLGERLKVMRTVDPNFAGLEPKEQGTVLYQAAQRAHPTPAGEDGPPDAGFLSTLGRDLVHLPGGLLRLANPVTASQDIFSGAKEMGGKAIDEAKSGHGIPAAGYGLASLLPIIGPAAAHAGEDFSAGQYGQGSAHALEALAPYLHDTIGPGAAFTRGAGSTALGEVGPFLRGVNPLEHPLAVLPDLINAVKNTFRGGMKGVGDYNTLQDIREGMKPKPMSGEPTIGRFDLGQYSAGAHPVRPPVEVGGGHIPDYNGPTIQPVQPPTPSEISGRPSTGRFIPGQYDAPAPRQPAPSGYQSIKPVAPSMVDVSASLPDVNPTQGSAGSGEQVTGLHVPDVPPHYIERRSPIAAHRLDLKVVDELRKVPGITKQTLTPEMLQTVRKEIGGSKIRAEDMDKIMRHIKMMLPE